MQKLTDDVVENENIVDKFVDAQSLRDITLTQEQIFEIAKNNLCETLMNSMVEVATKNGRHFYATNILADMPQKLLGEVMDIFSNLGYKLNLSETLRSEKIGKEYKVLTISWAQDKEVKEEAVQEVAEEQVENEDVSN